MYVMLLLVQECKQNFCNNYGGSWLQDAPYTLYF